MSSGIDQDVVRQKYPGLCSTSSYCKTYHQISFPFHLLSHQRLDVYKASTRWHQAPSTPLTFSRIFGFPRVHALEQPAQNNLDSHDEKAEEERKVTAEAMRIIAQAYIDKESGLDRVKMIFQEDHRGKKSIEAQYIGLTLVQTFIITFFMRYIPTLKFAKKEFIRENNATVFRTRIEASRKMMDHISLRATTEAMSFSARMTSFSASFLLISQLIASYRNKTTPLEYIAAAGITGGLARINLGPKGFIAGSFLGAVLGAVVGCAGSFIFKAYNITQEERHLGAIVSKLEVDRSVVGSDGFKKLVDKLTTDLDQGKLQPISAS